MLGRLRSPSTRRVRRPCCACASARCTAVVDFPSDGAELVIIRERMRRSKSVRRMELRRVRMASSNVLRPEAEEQIQSVDAVLKDIGAEGKPTLMVFNKIDQLNGSLEVLSRFQERHPHGVAIAA